MEGFWIFASVAVFLGGMSLWGMFDSWMKYRERALKIQAKMTAEKAAQYAASTAELEARVRTLEKIVTDGGMETAAQIEALREQHSLEQGDKIQ